VNTIEEDVPVGRRQRRRVSRYRDRHWVRGSVLARTRTCDTSCLAQTVALLAPQIEHSGLRRPRTNPSSMVRVHSGSPSMPVCVTGYTASTRVPMRRPCSEQSRDSGCSLQVRTRVLLRQPVDTASVPRASLRAQSAHRSRAQEHTLSLDYIAYPTGRKSRTGTI
jgi:hypothetical protein